MLSTNNDTVFSRMKKTGYITGPRHRMNPAMEDVQPQAARAGPVPVYPTKTAPDRAFFAWIIHQGVAESVGWWIPQWLAPWVMIPVSLGVVIWSIRSIRQIRLVERECRALLRELDRQGVNYT